MSRLFSWEVENCHCTLTPKRLSFYDTVPEILVVSNLAPINLEVPQLPDPPNTSERDLPVQFPPCKGWHKNQSFRRRPPDVSFLTQHPALSNLFRGSFRQRFLNLENYRPEDKEFVPYCWVDPVGK